MPEPTPDAQAPQGVPEPQNEPATEADLGPAGLAAPKAPEGAPLKAASAAPGSPAEATAEREPHRSAAPLVAAGIFASRLLGLVRERALAHFFGLGPHADVLRVAFRAPNLLQNLLGEGTVSAAFIPVYSRLLADGREEDAGRFAGAILGLLVALSAVLVLLGMALARPLMAVLAPGWIGDAARVAAGELPIDRFALSVEAIYLTFPMTGVLVLSAWALGVLNSHRRFFLPYVAPVLWNVAIIGALVLAGLLVREEAASPIAWMTALLKAALVGALVGGVLQFGVQLPLVFRVTRGFRLSLSTRVEGVREAVRAFGPVVAGRGVYQLSAYFDIFLGGFLAAGAIAALSAAQVLYILPISLFGMSVAASELPELSRISRAQLDAFLDRVTASLRQILFLIIPTIVGYLVFGPLVVGALYHTGSFGDDDVALVALVLGAYALGLGATTTARLLQNAFFALGETKTPARIAVWRVAASAAVGAGLMLVLDRVPVGAVPLVGVVGSPLRLGAVGLALGSVVGAWVELARLTAALRRHEPAFRLPTGAALRMLGLAVASSVPAAGLWALLPSLPVWLLALLVVGLYGAAYLGGATLLGLDEGEAWAGRFLRRFRR
ncbi:MAG TPA: murein biosynthesis integral membrane protein MurJ [Rubricoccaceae bacterium]|nr:murein biosynthesis integral membrane protein MurJ [Rubricoccaceae bacterium]